MCDRLCKNQEFWQKCQSCKTVKILTVVKFAEFLNFSLISNCSITMPNFKA